MLNISSDFVVLLLFQLFLDSARVTQQIILTDCFASTLKLSSIFEYFSQAYRGGHRVVQLVSG